MARSEYIALILKNISISPTEKPVCLDTTMEVSLLGRLYVIKGIL